MSIRAISQNPWRIWDPPVFPRTPQNNNSHSILPLKVMICSQKFIGSLESNTIMVDIIDSASYQEILNKANEPLKSPILWYVGIKCFLTFISFIASVAFIISLIFLSFLWAGISGIVVLTSFFCIRESGNQYYKTMQMLF
ncbi:hypothetical protein SteCoe_25878 [Stentor coeruleus]|uniref:Uncharacterized protein n=1 Tax=Stentor coeruleus TaxID=5963 RepID=A0A1R2BE64_9CILI|nr:hypothetical protein SteCoe_25878 [Stentor coeruleus]